MKDKWRPKVTARVLSLSQQLAGSERSFWGIRELTLGSGGRGRELLGMRPQVA